MNKKILGVIIGTAIQKIADSEPTTTTAGAILGVIIAAQIDWTKLFSGDSTAIGDLLGAVVILILGYYTNHKKFQGKL